jgi:hypothetical protein
VGTACYLVNRSPSSILDEKTPHKIWTGKKKSLKRLRLSHCNAYVYISKENNIKIDKKDGKCIFIG